MSRARREWDYYEKLANLHENLLTSNSAPLPTEEDIQLAHTEARMVDGGDAIEVEAAQWYADPRIRAALLEERLKQRGVRILYEDWDEDRRFPYGIPRPWEDEGVGEGW